MRPFLLTLCLSLSTFACSGDPDLKSANAASLSCQTTADCISRGGTCQAGECRADNQCAVDADCATGSCVADVDFGGLCTPAGQAPVPLPMWACTAGQDCPTGQGCGSDGLCHVDGECDADSDCAADQLCYNGGNDDPRGFCDTTRPSGNPYCRSDGQGACRSRCYSGDTCGGWQTCVDDFCQWDAECDSDADCTPNHVCDPYFDDGISVCEADPDPSCENAPDGVCRFTCVTDKDCTVGGGCAADGFCYAPNECDVDADCPSGQACHSVENFGGLCGAPR